MLMDKLHCNAHTHTCREINIITDSNARGRQTKY